MKNRNKHRQILDLFRSGMNDVGEIAEKVGARPSTVARVLFLAGLLKIKISDSKEPRRRGAVYSSRLRCVLNFKTFEAAQSSLAKIENFYAHCERVGDRKGQQHAQVLALTAYNRARWSGLSQEAGIFKGWLLGQLGGEL